MKENWYELTFSADSCFRGVYVMYIVVFKMADRKTDFLCPKVVFLLSGKRKSGKDFVANKLKESFGCDRCDVIRLSGPLKYEYARQNGLDFNRLLDSSTYKEFYRQDMIRWGEEKRNEDPSYFCRLAVQMTLSESCKKNRSLSKPVWIISDARRKTDVQFFKENYDNVISVRINASDETRKSRGWVFTPGVDDAESECGLDQQEFDVVIQNDGDVQQLNSHVNCLQNYACSA